MWHEPMAVALRLLGAFYMFAGVLAAKAVLDSWFVERATTALTNDTPSPAVRLKSWWLALGALFTFAGGVLLAGLLKAAVWLFVLSALWQAFYLAVLAPRVIDRDEPPDAAGRRGTRNAFVAYAFATGIVIAAVTDETRPLLHDAAPLSLALAGALSAGFLIYVAWNLMWRPR